MKKISRNYSHNATNCGSSNCCCNIANSTPFEIVEKRQRNLFSGKKRNKRKAIAKSAICAGVTHTNTAAYVKSGTRCMQKQKI